MAGRESGDVGRVVSRILEEWSGGEESEMRLSRQDFDWSPEVSYLL